MVYQFSQNLKKEIEGGWGQIKGRGSGGNKRIIICCTKDSRRSEVLDYEECCKYYVDSSVCKYWCDVLKPLEFENTFYFKFPFVT